MTRPLSDVREVLQLADDGLSKRAISLRTGISPAAIREWLADPDRALARGRRASVESMRCEARCGLWRGVNEPTYAYLLGMYLGDGCISDHARAYKLRISCADSYPRIMDEVAEAIYIVSGKHVGRVKREGCTEVNAYWQHWPCFFPQHGPGMKHERKIELVDWQIEVVERYPRPLLRGLIQSDGWRGKQFTNKSDDILKVFCDACDAIDVHWTQANRRTISVAPREDVFHLDSFIGPKR